MPRLHPTLLLARVEPINTKNTFSNPIWLALMTQEYDAHMKNDTNDTWSIVPFLFGKLPIRCKWGFSGLRKTLMTL